MKRFNLDGLKMNAIETDPDGVIDFNTIFHFKQIENKVYADYSGGKIDKGYLVGLINDSELKFRYCQLETDGTLNGGESVCELMFTEDSLIQIVEYFKWESKPGNGKNIIQQIPDSV